MSHLDIPWLQALKVGDSIRLCHTILYPRGQRRRVVAKHKRWLTLEEKTRVSLITGEVIQGHSPHCFYVHPWSET
jgi:hypothetical protein